MGIGTGLDIATRALRAQQLAVEVTSHNIANATTPGYSRQEVKFVQEAITSASSGLDPLFARVGNGVSAGELRRIRDQFLDLQMRQVAEGQGRYAIMSDGLQQIETVFNEPGDSGLNALFGKFWESWSDVANQPESPVTRQAVVEQASSLVSALRRIDEQLRTQQLDINGRVKIAVNEVNSLGQQIASLNQQISRLSAAGNGAIDLEDKRDLLLDQLATKVGISTAEQQDGSVTVFIGSQIFITGQNVLPLGTAANAGNKGYYDIQFEDGSVSQNVGGELQGLINLRDDVLATQLTDLNALATDLITSVNLVHRAGRGLSEPLPPANLPPVDFFVGSNIGSMAVNPTIAADPMTIRAGAGFTITNTGSANSANVFVSGKPTDPRPGTWSIADDGAGNLTVTFTPDIYNAAPPPDFIAGAPEGPYTATIAPGGTNSTLIPGVTLTAASIFGAGGVATITLTPALAATGAGDGKNALNMADLRATFDESYQSQVTSLGIDVREAGALSENQEVLAQHLDGLRQSVSGVNVDEEMMNLVKFQHAYNAAARLLTVVDEMLDKLINGTGVVGR